MAPADDLVANYEALRGQVLGARTGEPSSSGWVLLVRHGLAAWLQTTWSPKPLIRPLPSSSSTPEVVLAGLQSELTRVLVTMVWSHFQQKPA
jgi:hypothetical protein